MMKTYSILHTVLQDSPAHVATWASTVLGFTTHPGEDKHVPLTRTSPKCIYLPSWRLCKISTSPVPEQTRSLTELSVKSVIVAHAPLAPAGPALSALLPRRMLTWYVLLEWQQSRA